MNRLNNLLKPAGTETTAKHDVRTVTPMTTAAPFDLVSATSVDEVVEALAGDREARVLAGGQSLLPLLVTRTIRPAVLIDVNEVGLDGIDVDRAGGVLRIGALVRHRAVELSPTVATAAPLLAAAAAWVGHPAIRHRGTLGGSLAHADPAAELPAALVALGADVVVQGPSGTRHLAAASLATGPFETALAHDEIVVEVLIPLDDAGHRAAAFCEWAPRHRDRAEAGVGITLTATPDGRACGPGRGAACGFGTGPVDLTPIVDDALRSEPVDEDLSDALVRHVAAAVDGVCREHGGDDADRTALAGALAARAAVRAHRRLAASVAGEPGTAVA